LTLSAEELKEAYDAHKTFNGCAREAAAFLNLNIRTYGERLKKAKEKFLYNMPDDHNLKGVSNYEKLNPETGEWEATRRWCKSDKDKENAQEIASVILKGILDKIKPVVPTPAPKHTVSDLLAEYNLTDFHLGALAHAEESGDDWNIDIAEDLVRKWLLSAMDSVPNAHTAVLNNMGDYQHFSSMIAETPAHKHPLDAAARPYLIVRAAIRIMRMLIDELLKKHEHVHVKICDANHDPYGQLFLRESLRPLYESEPRVSIDDSPTAYYCYEWGDVSLFYHHGNKKNLKQISEVFVGTFRKIYGRTKFSYGRIGHFHHGASTEDCLMKTEIMPTLAPKDNHAAESGYLSKREAVTVVFHKKYGEVKRITTSPEMVL